jgi:hypothetical protein
MADGYSPLSMEYRSMRYPIALHNELEQIEAIVSKWNVEIRFNDVINWVLQFDSSDYQPAVS